MRVGIRAWFIIILLGLGEAEMEHFEVIFSDPSLDFQILEIQSNFKKSTTKYLP